MNPREKNQTKTAHSLADSEENVPGNSEIVYEQFVLVYMVCDPIARTISFTMFCYIILVLQ